MASSWPRTLGILAEHAVDDTDVAMEVRVQGGAEHSKLEVSAELKATPGLEVNT